MNQQRAHQVARHGQGWLRSKKKTASYLLLPCAGSQIERGGVAGDFGGVAVCTLASVASP
jgi:hypothetical protein